MSDEDDNRKAPERILVVDNEDFVLQAFERLFHGEPFETLTASSAESAMRILEARDIAVLVTDNEMAGLSGVDLLAWVHARRLDTVGIMLTGYAEVQTVIRAVNEAEVFRFFLKPCDFKQLKQAVHEALIVWSSSKRTEEERVSLQREVFFHEYLRQHCDEFERIWRDFKRSWPETAEDRAVELISKK